MRDLAKDKDCINQWAEASAAMTTIPLYWMAQYEDEQARIAELEAYIRLLEARIASYIGDDQTQAQTKAFPLPTEALQERESPAYPQERFLFGDWDWLK